MVNPTLVDRSIRVAINLIQGGIEDNEAVASLAKLHPEKDLAVVDFVKRLRSDLAETVDLKFVIRCLNCRGKITDVPCVLCNIDSNLPLRFELIDDIHWRAEQKRIQLARDQKKKGKKK